MRETNTSQSWTIFSSLHEALKEEELKKLRLARCSGCGRANPYRLNSLEITSIRCKRCGTSIQVGASPPKLQHSL